MIRIPAPPHQLHFVVNQSPVKRSSEHVDSTSPEKEKVKVTFIEIQFMLSSFMKLLLLMSPISVFEIPQNINVFERERF